MVRIGVLAVQGDFLEHRGALEHLGAEAREVRLPQDMEDLDGLVIPGGESTAIGRLLKEYGLATPLRQMAEQGKPVWGTCAGMILLARKVVGPGEEPLGLIDLEVRRNAFGRQVDSFEVDLPVPVLGKDPFHAVFIRAPVIEGVGETVQVLARLPNGSPAAAQQGKVLVTAFHPELTRDHRFHAYFLSLASNRH